MNEDNNVRTAQYLMLTALLAAVLYACIGEASVNAANLDASKNAQNGQGIFSVKDYGAEGDGKTDDTAAIQATIDAATAAHADVVFPASSGDYVASAIKLSHPLRLIGTGPTMRSATLHTSTNAPLLTITSEGVTVENLSFTGSSTPTFTAQDLIVVENVNNVYLRNLFLTGGYNNVRWQDTTFR